MMRPHWNTKSIIIHIASVFSTAVASFGVQTERFEVSCGGGTQTTFTEYERLSVRSRTECVVVCAKEVQCLASEYHRQSQTCRFFTQMDQSCANQIPGIGYSYIERSSVSCANGGTVQPDGSCVCPPGTTGARCEQDIAECGSSPCLYGTCVDLLNGFTCTCPIGMSGTICESDVCSPSPCLNTGACIPQTFPTFLCTCSTGFTGTTCETDIDDCSSSPCRNGGLCVDGIDSYTCTCPTGTSGPLCETDVCNPSQCLNGGLCVRQTFPSFLCNCQSGYTGTTCETEIDECSSSPCLNGGSCTDGVNGYTCACPSQFSGAHCESDPCDPSPCLNWGTCSQLIYPNYQCNCLSGYSGATCGTDDGPTPDIILSISYGFTYNGFSPMTHCPTGTYAAGFRLRVQADQGGGWVSSGNDDTSLNAIEISCRTPGTYVEVAAVSSHNGHFGDWTPYSICPVDHWLVSFTLRVQPYVGGGLSDDDTAANNIILKCRGPGLTGGSTQDMEGTSHPWGSYGEWSGECPSGSAICAISSRVENNQGSIVDDSALGDVQFQCCLD